MRDGYQKPRRPRNLALKSAIVQSGKSQRAVSIEARMSEIRLSNLIQGRGLVATAVERAKLEVVLHCDASVLFPEPQEAQAS